MFLCDSGNFEHFQYLVFFCFTYGKVKPFSKNWSNVFQLKVQILKTYHFRTKLPYQKPMLISIYLIISCVRVSLCVCIYVCFLTEQNNKCNVRVQVNDGMLWKYFCINYLCLRIKDNHRKNLQASNYAKECQLNRAKPREVKDNSYRLSKTNAKSAKHSYLSPH